MFKSIQTKFKAAAVAALTTVAVALPLQAQAQLAPLSKPTKVNMTHVPALPYSGLYVAVEKGYFKQRGLDVELHIVRGGDTTYQVAGGTMEFSGGSADSAFFNSLWRGMSLLAIGSLAVNGPAATSNPLVVRKDLRDSGSITTVAQLKGRKVANLAPGGITEYLLDLALGQAGLTVSDVDLVSPMGFSQMLEGFRTKAIEAALIAEPFATLGEQRGDTVRLSDRHDSNEQMLVIMTSKAYADAHPDVVKNFLAGYLMGARDLEKNGLSPENIAVIQKYTKLDPAVIKAAVWPVIPADGAMNVDSMMKQQKYFMKRGYVKHNETIPPEKFIDTSYLKEALLAIKPQ